MPPKSKEVDFDKVVEVAFPQEVSENVKQVSTSEPKKEEVKVPQEKPKVKAEEEKIWDEIKDVDLQMFGLENQPVQKYCKPLLFGSDKCHVTSSVSAVLPALEENLRKKFTVELQDKFIVIARK